MKISVIKFLKTSYFFCLLFVIISNPLQATDYVSANNTAWSTITTWSPNGNPGSSDNVIITHSITLSADASVNNLTISGGSLTISAGFQLTVNGNFSSISTGLATTNTSKLVLAGAGNQFVFPASVTVLQKITMNRANGASSDHNINLGGSPPADSIVLVFTNGVLTMSGTAELQLHSFAITRNITCSDASYVDGIVSRYLKNDQHWHDFPIGDGGKSRKMALSGNGGSPSATNINTGQFFYITTPDYNDYNTSNLPGGIYKNYYWQHIRAGINVLKRLYYQTSDLPVATQGAGEANLVLADYNLLINDQWNIAQTANNQRAVPASQYVEFITANNSVKNGWTFGSIDAGSPLPIELISFSGKSIDGKVDLEWKTATEKNNKGFTVQISSDGKRYTDLEFIKGKGTSDKVNSYTYPDLSKKTTGVYYYRLKQEDNNNNVSYSKIINVTVTIEVGTMEVSKLYPNPIAKGASSKINITLPTDGKVTLVIYNMMGQKVKEIEKDMLSGENIFEFETDELASGTYAYTVNFDLKTISGKFTHLSAPVDKKKEKDENVEKEEDDD